MLEVGFSVPEAQRKALAKKLASMVVTEAMWAQMLADGVVIRTDNGNDVTVSLTYRLGSLSAQNILIN